MDYKKSMNKKYCHHYFMKISRSFLRDQKGSQRDLKVWGKTLLKAFRRGK